MLARDLSRSLSRNEADADTIPWMNGLMSAAALVVILYMFPSEAALQKMVRMMFPMQTISAVQPSWRTFDWEYVGGMMAFQSKPTFIDTRFDSFEHLGVMRDSENILQGQDAFELMDKYRVDHALVKDNYPIAYLLQRSPAWTLVTREKALGRELSPVRQNLFDRCDIRAPVIMCCCAALPVRERFTLSPVVWNVSLLPKPPPSPKLRMPLRRRRASSAPIFSSPCSLHRPADGNVCRSRCRRLSIGR